MDTTTILPTPPTSGAIVQSSGHGYNDNGLESLILSNSIADNSRAVLAAIANGDAAIIAADQAGHLINQKATGDGTVASINATNLNGTANLKATYDAQVAGIEAANRNGVANITSTERNSGEIRMNVAKEAGESRLATAMGNSEIRELIRETSTDNLVAIKENGFAIREEGCKTRETVNDRFYALNTEMLKGFADNKFEALKNKCELEKQIAEICCCVEKDGNITRTLVLSENTKRLESELQEAKLKAAIAGLGKCDKDGK